MMPIELIRPGERVTELHYALGFKMRGAANDVGYSFPADEDGQIIGAEMTPLGWKNLQRCRANPDTYSGPEFITSTNSFWQPALRRCDCGQVIEMETHGNYEVVCGHCQREYDSSGGRLIPAKYFEPGTDIPLP